MKGTLALSWGPWGGFYVRWGFCKRLCLGWLALTFVPVELDDMMETYASAVPPGSEATASGDQNRRVYQ